MYSWRVSAGFDPVTGKRVVVNGKTYPTLKAAQTALNQAKVLRDENKLQGPTQETLASYAAEWLPRRQSTGKRPLAQTTALNYQRYIDQDIASARLGKMKLSDIKRSDVQGFLDGLTKAGRGATTVNRILATVRAILTGAVRDEKVSVNVARGVEGSDHREEREGGLGAGPDRGVPPGRERAPPRPGIRGRTAHGAAAW